MERQNFEESWKEAFDKAEVSPSESVWTNVELELEKADGGKMKRRLLFFKLLAAASVAFAMGVGSMTLYVMQLPNNTTELAQSNAGQQSIQPAESTNRNNGISNTEAQASTSIDSDNNTSSEARVSDAQKTKAGNNLAEIHNNNRANTSDAVTANRFSSQTNSLTSQEESTQLIAQARSTNLDDAKLTQPEGDILLHRKPGNAWTASARASLLRRQQEEADPVALMLARLDAQEASIKKSEQKKKTSDEHLWTSLGFAAGSFNTVSSGVSPSTSNFALASNSQIADNEAKASGTSYTVGVNVGTKLSSRWVLQGGVNYLAQSSAYTTQAAVGTANFQSFRPASIVELNKLNDTEGSNANKLVATAPYNVNNNVQYLSVPVQAGYLVVNKKFGVQVNAGVATDLFIQNTKSADSQQFDKVTQGRGSDSPYRPVNFSGLAGTELSYRFGKRYRLSVSPGLRYPLRSVYKSELGVQSTPVTFNVGLGFRYIFH